MAIALAILSVAIIALSMYGLFLPHRLIGLIDDSMSGRLWLGLWSAVTVRMLLAALLWFTAQLSQTPTIFQALAVMLFLSSIAHAVIGRTRLKKFRESLASWPPWAIRLPCLLGVAMGGIMLWAISSAIGAA